MKLVPLDNWYQRCYRRLLVDMHIPDWNPQFLSKLNAREYCATILQGNVTSTMLYCNSHVGHALYPSKLGPLHKGLGGQDFVGDAVRIFQENGVAVVAYYSAIYNNEIFLLHPDWRIQPLGDGSVYKQSRYGVCCPNSPYRDWAVAQTEELCGKYPFQGIFFDMLFWPYICYCPHCRARFLKEEGADIPTTVDWNNPVWMKFQRARERWMSEMAGALTAAVRRTRPSMTVTHQMSPVLHDWHLGMPFSLTEHCDYTSGDFYGPAIQQSLVCKLFESLSAHKPFEFHTSRCVDLWDHVTMKSATRMETQASLAPAHGAAFMFIDGIDPVGTLNAGVYERISRIFSRFAPYEKFLGGSLMADVAIYFSSESRFDFRENGVDVSQYTRKADNMAARFGVPHLDAVKGAARTLQEAHIPYAVIAKQNLDRLHDYKVIVLPNVLVMTEVEIAAMREYVKQGGSIYASGYSSLVDENGQERTDFGLADVFGVSKQTSMDHGLAFISPTDSDLAKLVSPQEHLIHRGGHIGIHTTSAKALATLTLPWYPENGGTVLEPSFASIHCTPPGPTGTEAAITWNAYGSGTACYAAGAIEAESPEISRNVVSHLLQRLLAGRAHVEAQAPRFVELTVFEKASENRLNISLVSLRESEDCLPCSGSVRVKLDQGRRPLAVRSLPEGENQPAEITEAGALTFEFTDFRIFKMFEVEYERPGL